MKRIVIAIVMLIFAISVSTLSAYLFNMKVSEIGNSVKSISIHPDKKIIGETISDWEDSKPFFKIVTVHESVNEIDGCFSALERADDEKEIRDICSEIMILLKIMDESEKASTENIF